MFGEDSLDAARSHNNVALALMDLARVTESEPHVKRSFDHNLTVQSEINLASVLARQKRAGESIPLFRQACDVYDKRFGSDSPHTKMVAYRLAVCLERTGNQSEGEAIRRKHHIEPDPPPASKPATRPG